VVRVSCDSDLFRGDFAKNADGDSKTGKGVPPHEILGNAEACSEGADFVFKEFAKGLDEF
jgi:hypothetical protein